MPARVPPVGVSGCARWRSRPRSSRSSPRWTAEPSRKPVDVPRCRLVAEDVAQRGVGVVGLLGCGQHVGERAPHVVPVGHAVAPYVGEEARGREPPACGQRDRGPADDRRRPARHEAIGVEEGHGQVAARVGPELVALHHGVPDDDHAPLRAAARLGRARRSRREDEIAQAHVAARHLRRGAPPSPAVRGSRRRRRHPHHRPGAPAGCRPRPHRWRDRGRGPRPWPGGPGRSPAPGSG